MTSKITYKRPLVLMAFLMLGVALMVVSANSAYATTHLVDLPFEDDFGIPPDYQGNVQAARLD